ncbi:MAG: flagellin [Acuticoccus sp.]
MTSLLTNVAAMVALQTLNQITRDLIETNDRVSTGLRIREASDSAAYWAIATTTRSDNGALGAVREAIALGRSVFDVAYSGLEHTRESLDKVKQLLVSATQPGINRANVQEEVSGLLSDMVNKAGAAVINEQNFLSIADSATENMTKSIVASFERQGGTVQISTIDVDVSTIYLVDGNATPTGILDIDRTAGMGATAVTTSILNIDISVLTDSATDLGILENYLQLVDDALIEVITAQNEVGVGLARAESQMTFVEALLDANERSIGALVDANMEEESTRLRALQTQQQLAVQSLAIANTSAQNILQLFQ